MIDRKWIGHALDRAELTLERGRLRFFAQAIGETDPVYTDVAAARAAGYADLPCPPTFLFSAELDAGNTGKLLALLEVPLGKILHGEQSFTYHLPVVAGDTVTVSPRISQLYDKKDGALEFIEKTASVHNQRNELVAELRTVIVVRH